MGSGDNTQHYTWLPPSHLPGQSSHIKPLVLKARDIEVVREKTGKSAEEVRLLYDSFKGQFPKEKIFKE